MIDYKQIIEELNNKRIQLREDLKEKVQKWIDSGELDYYDAIRIFESSKYFETSSYILNDGILEQYNEDIAGYGERYRTIYFSDVLEWVADNEEGIQESYNSTGGGDIFEELYKYAVDNDTVSYIYDW